jgi:hypothetical protein
LLLTSPALPPGAGVGAGTAAADASTDADDLGAEKHVEGAEVDEDDTVSGVSDPRFPVSLGRWVCE